MTAIETVNIVDEAIEIVCKHFEVDKADILKKGRKFHHAAARQVCCLILRKEFAMSAEQLGKLFGYSPGSMCDAVLRAESKIFLSQEFANKVAAVVLELASSSPAGAAARTSPATSTATSA